MAFYYVKSGGTAAGDNGRTTTKRTGAFGAVTTYYTSVRDALTTPTTPPVAGDIILVSHLHNFDNAASAYTPVFPISGTPVQVISVDDAAQDSSKSGALEQANSLIRFDGKSSHYGITYDTSTSVGSNASNSSSSYLGCTFNLTTSSDNLNVSGDGCYMNLTDCTVHSLSTSTGLAFSGGAVMEIFGGAFTSSSTVASLIQSSSGSGGGALDICGTDLSVITGFLLSKHGSSHTTDDNLNIVINGCKLNASVGFVEETLANLGTSILVTNSSSTSVGAEYQYYYEDYFGSAQDQDDSGIHRFESTSFSSGTKVSINATTKSTTSIGSSFTLDFPSIFANLSNASTDTIRIYFASTTALTDNDVWAELVYPDGTNKHLYNYLSNQSANVLSAGTIHTDDSASSTWKNGGVDLTGYNEYRMDLVTSGNVGADSVPIIRIHVAKTSTTVYFDTTVDVVA